MRATAQRLGGSTSRVDASAPGSSHCRKRPATLPLTRASDRASRTPATPLPRRVAAADSGLPSLARRRRSGDAVAGSGLARSVSCSSLSVSPAAGGGRARFASRVSPRFPRGARRSSRALGAVVHRAPCGDRRVGPGLGAGGPRPPEARHHAAGRRSCRLEPVPARSHRRARARARPPSRLPGEPRADRDRDAVLLSSGRLVGVAAGARRARALLRRSRGDRLPQPRRLRPRAARPRGAPGPMPLLALGATTGRCSPARGACSRRRRDARRRRVSPRASLRCPCSRPPRPAPRSTPAVVPVFDEAGSTAGGDERKPRRDGAGYRTPPSVIVAPDTTGTLASRWAWAERAARAARRARYWIGYTVSPVKTLPPFVYIDRSATR